LDGADGDLEKVKVRISEKKKELDGFEAKADELDRKKDQLNKAILSLQDQKWTLERQIQFIKIDGQIKALKLDPREVQNKHCAAKENLEEFQAESEELNEKIIKRKERLSNINTQLSEPQFSDSVEQFMDSVAKKQVYAQQAKDLTYLRKVILAGISEYHSKKMEQVNILLNRYWRNIYLGQDILTIYIKCEAAGGTGAGAGKYTYKIMCKRVVKDSDPDKIRAGRKRAGVQEKTAYIEDELRGRCSTGQKAIACIVIRLALSQAFCTGPNACRVFALDEPTTSLDRKTIKSFCHSVFKIIDIFKESGCPIQLLIITHDSDFMTELYRKRRESVDQCIKVQKSADDGYSKLARVKMIDIVPQLYKEEMIQKQKHLYVVE